MKIDIFLIGLATIPFDNTPLSPSGGGWAPVSPIVFFVYCFINFKLLIKVITQKRCMPLICMFVALLFQFILISIYGIRVKAFISALRTLILGLSFYFALLIRYEVCCADINSDAKILYKAYVVSFIYGIIWLLIYTISPSSIDVFNLIELRHKYTRLKYTFSEPSLITLHTIGVMFLFTYFIKDDKLAIKFVRLGFAFMILSILTVSSARCAVDFAVLLLLIFIRNLFSTKEIHAHEKMKLRKTSKIKKLAINVLIIFAIIIAFSLSPRLNNIAKDGTNGDASTATRWFYINAVLAGLSRNISEIFAGWGMGNMTIPLQAGYNGALASFYNKYTIEVYGLAQNNNVAYFNNLYIRLITEWGVVITVLIFLYMFIKSQKKKIDVYVFILMCWLYVQLDSYCFYTMWLLLYLVNYYDPKRHGISFFDIIS